MTESPTSPNIEHFRKGPSVTVKYENDRTFHKSKVRGGRDWWWAWPKVCLGAPQRIHTMAAGKRGKQTIFRPAESSKKYEKKIIKNSENS